MPVTSGDIKLYQSTEAGAIDLTSEITSSTTLFPPALDIANDVEKKIWVKNTNDSSSLYYTKFYIVNGHTVTNTNNTPVDTSKTELYVNHTPGTYSLTFPTVNSVVVTPPSGQARAAQDIVADGSTLNTVYLADNSPIFLVFNSSLSTADTATVKISDGGSFIQTASDNAGSPATYSGKYSYSDGVDIGTLAAGGTQAIWLKQAVPDGTSNQGNPRKFLPIVRGDAS